LATKPTPAKIAPEEQAMRDLVLTAQRKTAMGRLNSAEARAAIERLIELGLMLKPDAA
jgi:hypothetical protein